MRTLLIYGIVVALALVCLPSRAQVGDESSARPAYEEKSAFSVAIGRTHQQDTYLSPLEYSGPQVTLMHEAMRMTHWAKRRVSFQSLLQGTFSYTENHPATANYWGGRIAYDAGWHRHWQPLPCLRIMAGGQVGTDFGILYNNRNGNNPAQGRLSFDVAASVGGFYSFRLRRQPFVVRYQADFPLLGCMFSPQFGQSYYELSKGNRDHNVCFAWPGCAPSVRQLLTLDIPFRRYSLRLGYLSDVRQSHVNHIKVHDIGRSFMLGFVRHLTIQSKGKQ